MHKILAALGDAQGYDNGKCPFGDVRFKYHIPYNYGGRRFELYQTQCAYLAKILIRTIRPLKLFPEWIKGNRPIERIGRNSIR